MRVNEQLDISSMHSLNINHTNIAIRINLTAWKLTPGSTCYLTFLHGRIGNKATAFLWIFSEPTLFWMSKRKTLIYWRQ
nr:nucleoid-associated protein [Pantoea sp. Nvir]